MNIQQLLQMGQKMQAQMSRVQEDLNQQEISASSGGGMVTVTVDGKGQVKNVSIDPTVVDPGDVEMLEDLVLAALSEAQNQAREAYEQEMQKVAGGLPFPMKLPGMF
jgi:nucleoid-associated protein EbfC